MTLSFGPSWQRELWASPFSLRFQLDDGDYFGRYVTKFTNSFDRARAIARMALPTERVVAVIGAYPDPSREINAEWHGWVTGTGFEHLANLGVSTDAASDRWRGYWHPDDEDDRDAEPCDQCAVSLDWEKADILIWNQVAHDLGVAPAAPIFAKLVDVERGVCVYVYDDRGMDVTALTKEPLSQLYIQANDWLLDYDRARMSAAFEA